MSQSRLKHAHTVLQGTLWKTGDSGMVFLVHGSFVVGTCAGEPILTEHQAFQTLRVACGANPAEHCGGGSWSYGLGRGEVSEDWWRSSSEIYSNWKGSSYYPPGSVCDQSSAPGPALLRAHTLSLEMGFGTGKTPP